MSFSVIIPSRSAPNLSACLMAIEQCEPGAKVIVVDDGIAVTRMRPPARILLRAARVISGVNPFVFSRNINLGIVAAGTDDVVLLNDDALLRSYNGFKQLEAASLSWDLVAAVTNNTGQPRQTPRNKPGVRFEQRMVAFICVYIPRRTLDRVGLLDEDYTDYGYDDDDYCYRVRKAGLRIGICDDCFVDHAVLASSYRSNRQVSFVHNREVFVKKHGCQP